MGINFELLKKITETPGTSGFEDKIRRLVIDEIKGIVDEYRIDNMGNLIAIKRGNKNPDGKKVMLAAHLDEIGFMVTHIEDSGFLCFTALGGFDNKSLVGMRVIVHGKKDLVGVMVSKPLHLTDADQRSKVPAMKEFAIDLGISKEEAEKFFIPGNPVTRLSELLEIGEMYNGKSLDNRVSVYILLETLKALKSVPYDVYAAFTVQEEVGIRGAKVATHSINPDFAINIDTTIAFDTPGGSGAEQTTKLNGGVAIKVMDSSVICDTRMVDFLRSTASREGIDWQTEILVGGGTDTSAMQMLGKHGSIAGALSIPTRNIHQVTESVGKKDVAGTISLLVAALETIDKHHWEF